MSRIRFNNRVYPMNRAVSEMANSYDLIHDIDCIYYNRQRMHWLMIEWKNCSEQEIKESTLSSLIDIDSCFVDSDQHYVGLFVIRVMFDVYTFPLDDTQQCQIVHWFNGQVRAERNYTTGAKSAIQHILDYGRLQ